MTDRRHLIFISYRGTDQIWATELLYAQLTAAFGAEAVFKAGNAIRGGEVFPPILRKQAAACPVMLVCIGPGWLTAGDPGRPRLDLPDDWVRREIAIALQAGNHVIPLLIGNHDEVAIPPPDRLPDEIRAMAYFQALRLVPGGGLDLTVPRLIARLAELVPELDERRAPGGSQLDSPTPAPTVAAAHGVARDGSIQENTATGSAMVFAVQNGSQHVDLRDRPGPAARPSDTGRSDEQR